MKKILAFAGSNSSTSINQQLLNNIVARLESHEVKMINLTDYPLPMYGIDHETDHGAPERAQQILDAILASDALVVAVNEHNGTVSAFFKNVIDWVSRIKKDFLSGKKILLVSTSPGARGAKNSLAYTKDIFGRFGGDVVESFSFPSFKDNFENGQVTNEVLDMGIQDVVTTFAHQIEV